MFVLYTADLIALVKSYWLSTASVCSERCGSANFQNSTVITHHPSAPQPSLVARPRTYLLQTGSYDVSIHSRHLSVLPTVMFHPRFQHEIQTTAAVFYLTSSFNSRQRAFPVSGATVWNDVPLHVASAPSLAVFRQ